MEQIKRNSFFLSCFQIRSSSSSSWVVVVVVTRRVVARRCLGFLSHVSYSLFTCTECLYPPSQSSGPHAPTKRARYREATSRLEFRPLPPLLRRHYHILLEILCLTSPSSRTHAYAFAGAATLCVMYRNARSHV